MLVSSGTANGGHDSCVCSVKHQRFESGYNLLGKKIRNMHVKIGRNDPCWCGSMKKYKNCHQSFDEKIEELRSQGHIVPDHSLIKTPEQIAGVKESAKINIAVLDEVASKIKEGMTTEEIDKIVYDTTTKMGGIPAPLNYEGFPKSVCTSINEEVCHGIPSPKVVLKDGDIINVDVSTIYTRDIILIHPECSASAMFLTRRENWFRSLRSVLKLGLEQVKPWGFLGDMSQAVYDHAVANGYQVVRNIGGHGVGLEFHEDPWVGYIYKKGTQMVMAPGMMFTIEPMVNMGTHKISVDKKNGWTVYTNDKKPSAQWEIQVLVTEDGHEVIAY